MAGNAAIFVGTLGQGIWRSTDRGETSVSLGLIGRTFTAHDPGMLSSGRGRE